MELFKQKTSIPFLSYRWYFIVMSVVLTIGAVVIWFQTGESKFSVDFSGGIELLVEFPEKADIGAIRKALEDGGLKGFVVQEFAGSVSQYSVRLKTEQIGDTIKGDTVKIVTDSLSKVGKFNTLKKDEIGPVIGKEVRQAAVYALAFALLAILVYISVRFEFRFALGGVLALFHDVIVTSGVYLFTGHEVDSAMLAGVLTIIGFSINDTIVVFDRIRENMLKADKKGEGRALSPFERLEGIMNRSINETLSRTLLTSLTAWFVAATLLFLGGGALENLAYYLFVGIAFGTYSSVYIASTLVLYFESKAVTKQGAKARAAAA